MIDEKALGTVTAASLVPPQYGVKAPPDPTAKVDCPLCDGSGKIKAGHVSCPECGGAGKLTQAQIDAYEKSQGGKGVAYQAAPYHQDPDETVKCPSCGDFNDTDATYCDQCGAKLPGGPTTPYHVDPDETVVCPECEKRNDTDARYCDQCGTLLLGRTDVEISAVTGKAVSRAAWDGSASNYPSTEAYCDACLLDLNAPGVEKIQSECHLPVKDAQGNLNVNAIQAAAGGHGISQVTGISPEDRKAAASKLVALYRATKQDPPDSLLTLAGAGKSFAATGYTAFADIKAVEETENGDLIVEGYATTWADDREQEAFLRSGFEEAVDQFMLNPIVLLQHQISKRLGKVVERPIFDNLGVKVRALIPKPSQPAEAWHQKAFDDIKNGILRTFSPGGVFYRNPSTSPNKIIGLDWQELSVAAVPVNPYSIFQVAGAKGLEFIGEEKAVAGARPAGALHHHGPVSGARRTARATRRISHVHPYGGPHIHGLHRHGSSSSMHQHGPTSLDHNHGHGLPAPMTKNKFTPIGMGPGSLPQSLASLSLVSGGAGGKAAAAPGATADPPSPLSDTDDPGTGTDGSFGSVSDLMDGLHDAVVMTQQAAAPDADKVATLQGILEDFTEEAQSLVGGGEGDQDESGEGDDAPGVDGKARLIGPAAVDTALAYVRGYGRPDLAATISSVLAGKAADVKEVRTPMGAEAGTETPVLPGTTPPAPASAPAPAAAGPVEGKAIEAMAQQLSELQAEKAERDMAAKAEAEAAKRIEAEGKAQQVMAEQKAIADAKLQEAIEAAVERQRQAGSTGRKFVQTGSVIGGKAQEDPRKGMANWLLDLRRSKRGDQKALERLETLDTEARAEYGLKAVAEGSTASGGYLVPPQYWQAGLAEYRIAAAKVRPLCTVITAVDSDQVLIPRETGIAIVGWTAENAAKPSQDQTFGQIAVPIFALAGISKVSNQLLEDSSPAVDQILRKDLGRTLGQAEDIAFLEGTGNGQPTGILNTTGVLNLAYSSDAAGSGLADAISAAIVAIETNYFGAATAIVCHPRNVNILRKVKDTAGRYIFEAGFMPQLTAQLGGPSSFMGGDPQQPGPVGSVWGLPVISDANMATNYSGTTQGGGTESPLLVANWSEAYIFERSGVTVDVSNEAGTAFESNQTWYRGEERIGFTAARQPTAFCYITGLGTGITN